MNNLIHYPRPNTMKPIEGGPSNKQWEDAKPYMLYVNFAMGEGGIYPKR